MEENIMKKFGNNKKRANLLPLILAATMLLSACGSEEQDLSAPVVESIDAVSDTQQETAGQPAAQQEAPEQPAAPAENAGESSDVLTEEQAYAAVINYNKSIGSGYDGEINSDGYSEYWDVSTEDGKIVVLYRSYTAAQIRYYVDPVSGETYVTELVPGIIDEEQENGETFNARDYLEGPGQSAQTQTPASSDAPVEYETADGFMGSFLLSSDRDKIDTTNDYGVFYRVIYKATLEGDELTACGSMDYRNSKDQDPITISSDVTHVFKVDDNTVYMKGGEEGTETVSKEEFAGYLESRKDSGMYFEVEIVNGTVKTAQMYAQ